MSTNASFTELLIKQAIHKFCAPRRETTVSTSAGTFTVHKPGERILHLPNGSTVKVSVDDSGISTQVEEDDHLHAIVRPKTFTQKIGGMR